MKKVKIITGTLHIICKAIGGLYILTALYAGIVILIGKFGKTSLFEVPEPGGFIINFPFTRQPFLLGDNTPHYLIMMIVLIAGYGMFAWLLGNVFNVFTRAKLFTPANVRTLTIFYLLNFIVPLTILLIDLMLGKDVRDLIIIVILHATLATFAWLIANIINQGVPLQDEQDYTL
jgi:hypothetical protein